MQKSTYKTPFEITGKATENIAEQPRINAGSTDILNFVKVSSARHVKFGQLLADWSQKPPP